MEPLDLSTMNAALQRAIEITRALEPQLRAGLDGWMPRHRRSSVKALEQIAAVSDPGERIVRLAAEHPTWDVSRSRMFEDSRAPQDLLDAYVKLADAFHDAVHAAVEKLNCAEAIRFILDHPDEPAVITVTSRHAGRLPKRVHVQRLLARSPIVDRVQIGSTRIVFVEGFAIVDDTWYVAAEPRIEATTGRYLLLRHPTGEPFVIDLEREHLAWPAKSRVPRTLVAIDDAGALLRNEEGVEEHLPWNRMPWRSWDAIF